MTLRSKLTFAFFAISVVPLAAVTLYSYSSSERALRRAAERQADTLAAELGHRMESVTADLERRMDRMWPLPSEEMARTSGEARAIPPAMSSEAVTGHIAGVLSDIAPMLESLELVPAAPPAPPAPESSGDAVATARPAAPPPPPPAPPASVGRRGPSPGGTAVAGEAGQPAVTDEPQAHLAPGALIAAGRVVVEMSQVIARATKSAGGNATPENKEAWKTAIQEEIARGMASLPTPEEWSKVKQQLNEEQAARSQRLDAVRQRLDARRQAREAEGQPREAKAARLHTVAVLKGNALDCRVERDGETIGRINAKLNADRLYRAVLDISRGNRHEIPFAVDATGQVYAPQPSDRAVLGSLNLTASLPEDAVSIRSVNDWVIATRRDPSGATFGIARPIGDDLRDLRKVAVWNFGVGFALIALVFVGSVPLAGGMTRNLRTLMDGVQRLSRGDLGARVALRSRDEFGRLGAAFNQMAENLAAHEKLVVEQGRMRRELELCRQIQTDMLPQQPLRLELAEVKGLSIPAREVGGDFFNYFVLPDGGIALVVGDVSGKGVGAALLMANVQATLRARLPLECDLARLADALDRDLQSNTPPEVYLTLFVGVVDPARRELRYVSAGHNTQFLLHSDGRLESMASTGMPLGLLAGHGYEERVLALSDGDAVFLYTDGMVEAENETGDMFGADRLDSLLRQSPNTDVDALLARAEADVRAFRGHAEPSDDATMMALRFGRT